MAWTRDIVVRRRRWCSEEEFAQALALCQLVPGANTLNMAAFLGCHLRGPGGAAAALLGLTTIPFALVLTLGLIYGRLEQGPAWQAVFRGLGAAAAGVALGTAVQMAGKHLRDVRLAMLAILATLGLLLRLPMLAVVTAVLGLLLLERGRAR